MKRGLPTIVYVLLGLLGIGSVLVKMGQRDLVTNPSPSSFTPSGTSALTELLKRRYTVRTDRWSTPRLAPDEIVIAFVPRQDVSANILNTGSRPPVEAALQEHLKRGGRVLQISYSDDFPDATRRAMGEVRDVADTFRERSFKINYDSMESEDSEPAVKLGESEDPRIDAWWLEDDVPYLTVARVGKGTLLSVADGIAFTNRFLDREQNAAAALALTDILAGPNPRGAKFVITEATFGNAYDPGLLETIGAWALASWYQLWFLALVVVYTLGRRFGLPEPEPRKKPGARELLDALSDTYLRGRHTRVALQTILGNTQSEVRYALRLPRDADLTLYGDSLTPELRQALAKTKVALTEKQLHPTDTLPLVRELLEAKAGFLNRARNRH